MKLIDGLKKSEYISGGTIKATSLLNIHSSHIPNTMEHLIPSGTFEELSKKLEITDKLIKEEIQEADKVFAEKLIQLFENVKNKVKI